MSVCRLLRVEDTDFITCHDFGFAHSFVVLKVVQQATLVKHTDVFPIQPVLLANFIDKALYVTGTIECHLECRILVCNTDGQVRILRAQITHSTSYSLR